MKTGHMNWWFRFAAFSLAALFVSAGCSEQPVDVRGERDVVGVEDTDAMFQDSAWNRTLPHLALFDDVFVDANIHSGLSVDARHRQNLHGLVLGARGVTLSRELQELVSRIEQHNKALREKAGAITETVREGHSVDDFCALPELPGVDAEIEATERALAAARDQDAVRTTPLFDTLELPAFDTGAIDLILERDLPDLDAAAEAHVQNHVKTLGGGGEQWVGDGMQRVPQSDGEGPCPFCAQDLVGSPLIAHYRAYFSAAYGALKRAIVDALEEVRRTHSGDVPAGFERAVRVAGERRQFWSRFCEVPEVGIDTAAVVRDWNAAREAVIAALNCWNWDTWIWRYDDMNPETTWSRVNFSGFIRRYINTSFA